MDNHTILMLGGGTMQLPAIHSAKSRGWTVILADGNGACVARSLVDAFHHVDLVDLDGLIAVAERYDLDGVFTAGTDFSTSVAYVAERRGLPGIPYQTAQRATDKLRMRQCFVRAGVPSPDYVEIEEGQDPAFLLDRLGLPVVVKPVDNMGARGVGADCKGGACGITHLSGDRGALHGGARVEPRRHSAPWYRDRLRNRRSTHFFSTPLCRDGAHDA